MQKVLIISYFFPPSNFVGGERINYWANNLSNHNIYPIIISRCWNKNQKDIIGKVLKNEDQCIKEKNHTIYFLKYKYNFRDYIERKSIFRQLLTVCNQLSFYMFPRTINYYNFYKKAYEIISKENIKTIIVSGRPFESFYFGYKIKKKNPSLNWIPDYRDQWNTYQDITSTNKLTKVFSLIEKRLEKKWTSNCLFFMTTSEIWKDRIESFINKKGFVILNGFEGEMITEKQKIDRKSIKIIYAGTLYPNQIIEDFTKEISKLNCDNNNIIEIEFIGCETYKGQKERLSKIKKNHIGKFLITDRISKADLNKKLLAADIYYLTGFKNVKGWYPVKLFEYMKFPGPIILYPSDENVMEELINNTKSGFFPKNSTELNKLLNKLIDIKGDNQNISTNKNIDEVLKHSRSHQTSLLAAKLKNI